MVSMDTMRWLWPAQTYRGLVAWLTAGLLALLTGCASGPVVKNAPDPLRDATKAGESPVVVSVTVNTGQVTAMDGVWVRRLTGLAPGEKPSEHILRYAVPGLARDTSLFVGALPPGEYEIARFDNSETRRFLALSEGMRSRIGRFVVDADHPVDLGRLLITPVNTRVVVGRSARVNSNKPLMQRFSPGHLSMFERSVPGWLTDRTERDRVEEYALSAPTGAGVLVPRADGSVVTASRLGAVLVRSPQGRWRALRGPGLETLMDVMPVSRPDAELLAVGEFATLWRQPPGSDQLVPMDTGDLPSGNLLFIAGSDPVGWYVMLQSGAQVRLMRSDKLDAGHWETLRTEKVGFDFWHGIDRVWTWRTDDGLAYAASSGEIHFLNFSTSGWVHRAAPNKDRLILLRPNPDGSLGALTSPGGGFGGVFAGTWLSRDAAQSWQEVKSPFKVKMAAPLRTKAGALLVNGGAFGDPELQVSQDEGQTWRRLIEFPMDRTLHVMPWGDYLTVDSGQFGLFSIRHSSDGGATWRTEYSNFDRAAYDAEKAAAK